MATCSRCGVHGAVRDLRRFGVILDGRLTVERPLCVRCLDRVLEAVTEAVRPAGRRPHG